MFGLFRKWEDKQKEFLDTIRNSRGWSRDFNGGTLAEHGVLRVEISRNHHRGPFAFNNWKIEVYHFERPDKIIFRTTDTVFGRNIYAALAQAHHICWLDHQNWRRQNGYIVYPAPRHDQKFRIAA